ncbi:MAG: LysR family transcriptional regulator [Myxococcota bacterium]
MSFDDRWLFVELSRSGSYAETARKLGLARSTVMRRIDVLEEEMGVALVHRAGRSIALTEAGTRFAEGLRGVFRALERVEEEARSSLGEATGTLRLWLPILGTPEVVVQALAVFQRAHPRIQLRVELGRGQRTTVGEFDVLLQMGHRSNPDLQALTLFREQLVLVASPTYLESRGIPTTLEDLDEHVAIEQRDASGRVVPWRGPDGTRLRMPRAAVSTQAPGYVYAFALHHTGIGRVARSMAREALDDGRLVEVLPEIVIEEPISLVYLPQPSPKTRLFLDFMAEQRDAHLRHDA